MIISNIICSVLIIHNVSYLCGKVLDGTDEQIWTTMSLKWVTHLMTPYNNIHDDKGTCVSYCFYEDMITEVQSLYCEVKNSNIKCFLITYSHQRVSYTFMSMFVMFHNASWRNPWCITQQTVIYSVLKSYFKYAHFTRFPSYWTMPSHEIIHKEILRKQNK